MKLSNKGRYAVQAVFDLAFHGEGKSVQVKEICQRQDIPARFLEQVFQDLKKAGVVGSKRGPRGGYQLAHAAAEIRLGDVIRAVEGPIVLSPVVASETPTELCTRTVLYATLSETAERLNGCLDEITIAELCRRAEADGVPRGAPTGYVYAI